MSQRIIQLYEGAIMDQLKALVCGSVEETLNVLLEKALNDEYELPVLNQQISSGKQVFRRGLFFMKNP